MVIRLVPKTTAATTAATATITPATALRTGTAVRPRPGSNAIRTPTLPGTDPASPATRASRDGRPRRRLGHRQRAALPARGPPGSRHQHGQRQHRDRDQAGPQHGQVDLGPRGRLGQPGRADRHQRRGRDGHPHRQDGPRERDRGQPGQGQHGQTGPGHAQRPKDGELRRVQDHLAGQQLTDHGQPDQPGQHREDRQRHRLRPDRPLGRRHLIRKADDTKPPPVAGKRLASVSASRRNAVMLAPGRSRTPASSP